MAKQERPNSQGHDPFLKFYALFAVRPRGAAGGRRVVRARGQARHVASLLAGMMLVPGRRGRARTPRNCSAIGSIIPAHHPRAELNPRACQRPRTITIAITIALAGPPLLRLLLLLLVRLKEAIDVRDCNSPSPVPKAARDPIEPRVP